MDNCNAITAQDNCEQPSKTVRIIHSIIFSSKWLLIPFYVKLFWTLLKLLYSFIFHGHITSVELTDTLEDVDIVMIANLVKMIITGSYNSFVDRSHGHKWENISSGALKVKMATSILGVSAIHLLRTFVAIETENTSWNTIWKQTAIHGIFIVGALVLALIDYLHEKSETFGHEKETNNSGSNSVASATH